MKTFSKHWLARATTGVGAFDNAMAGMWFEPCRYESLELGGGRDPGRPVAPTAEETSCDHAQYAVASAEVVALLKGVRSNDALSARADGVAQNHTRSRPGSVSSRTPCSSLERRRYSPVLVSWRFGPSADRPPSGAPRSTT